MDTSILQILKQLRQRCEKSDEDVMSDLGLSPAEFQFFQASLYENEIDTSLIATKTGLSASRLSRIIEKMVQNGYLARTENKDDRRAICISFTDKGNEIIGILEDNRRVCEAKLIEHLTDEQRTNLRDSLNYLIKNV